MVILVLPRDRLRTIDALGVPAGQRANQSCPKGGAMASWAEVTEAAPELAEAVRRLFDEHKHKTMATLRRDGSPRISGVEATFEPEELWIGMMPESRKARDLQRDPRMALHTAGGSGEWRADAKLSGLAVEVPADGYHRFRIDVTEIVLTRLGDPPDHLVIEWWREGQPVRRARR